MEKVKLAPTEWAQRRLSGLPLEGCELIVEERSPKQEVFQETRDRFLAGVDPAGAKRLLYEMVTDPGAYPGSFEWRKARILEKAKSQGALQGVKGDDIEIVATYEDRAIVWDLIGDRFFEVEYELSDAGEVTLGSVREMESKLVVKEHHESVRKFFSSLLSEMKPGRAKSIVRIARHLIEHGSDQAAAEV